MANAPSVVKAASVERHHGKWLSRPERINANECGDLDAFRPQSRHNRVDGSDRVRRSVFSVIIDSHRCAGTIVADVLCDVRRRECRAGSLTFAAPVVVVRRR